MKTFTITLLFVLLNMSSLSWARPGQNHTPEQRECMESILGKPGEGERPSKEEHKAAMQQCGIEENEQSGEGGRGGGPRGDRSGGRIAQ